MAHALATKVKQSAENSRQKPDTGSHRDAGSVQRSEALAVNSPRNGFPVPPIIQAKLKIGAPDDQYEREADRVADQVMRMPAPDSAATGSGFPAGNSSISSYATIQRSCSTCANEFKAADDERRVVQSKSLCPKCRTAKGLLQTKPISPFVQRQKNFEEEDEQLIQTKSEGVSTPAVTPAISSGIDALQGRGQPLSRSERSFFEPRFGADFSGVRVHHDAWAADLARSVNARAFTHGNNVVFGGGEYSSGGRAGSSLLAHELTHVIQQSGKGLFCKSQLLNMGASAVDNHSARVTSTPLLMQLKPATSKAGKKQSRQKKLYETKNGGVWAIEDTSVTPVAIRIIHIAKDGRETGIKEVIVPAGKSSDPNDSKLIIDTRMTNNGKKVYKLAKAYKARKNAKGQKYDYVMEEQPDFYAEILRVQIRRYYDTMPLQNRKNMDMEKLYKELDQMTLHDLLEVNKGAWFKANETIDTKRHLVIQFLKDKERGIVDEYGDMIFFPLDAPMTWSVYEVQKFMKRSDFKNWHKEKVKDEKTAADMAVMKQGDPHGMGFSAGQIRQMWIESRGPINPTVYEKNSPLILNMGQETQSHLIWVELRMYKGRLVGYNIRSMKKENGEMTLRTIDRNGKVLKNVLTRSGDLTALETVQKFGRDLTTVEDIHDFFDILGWVPVIGEVFDLANAGFYYYEGKHTDALLSMVALLPFAGSAAAKGLRIMRKGSKVALIISKETKAELIEQFGKGGFRKVFNATAHAGKDGMEGAIYYLGQQALQHSTKKTRKRMVTELLSGGVKVVNNIPLKRAGEKTAKRAIEELSTEDLLHAFIELQVKRHKEIMTRRMAEASFGMLIRQGGRPATEFLEEISKAMYGIPVNRMLRTVPEITDRSVGLIFDHQTLGGIKNLRVQFAADATVKDVLDHIPALESMRRYQGTTGAAKTWLDRLGIQLSPPIVAIPAWEEMKKLPGLIDQRTTKLAIDPKISKLGKDSREFIESEIHQLRKQLNDAYHDLVIDMPDNLSKSQEVWARIIYKTPPPSEKGIIQSGEFIEPPKSYEHVKLESVNDLPINKAGGFEPLKHGMIYEFDGGHKVWRERGGIIRHDSILSGSSRRRQGLEKGFFAAGRHGEKNLAKMERSHTLGQGTGWESPFGIYYAPREVNRELQNQGIEGFLRQMQPKLPRGQTAHIRTSTISHLGTLRLKQIHYRIDLDIGGGKRELLFEYKIDVDSARVFDPNVSDSVVSVGDSVLINRIMNSVNGSNVFKDKLKEVLKKQAEQ